MTRVSLVTALNEVKRRDPVLRRLVTQVGPIRHRPRNPDGHFGALARSIVFQQLAGAAARAIHGRLVAALGGNLSPESLARTSDRALRAAGLSANKLAALRDLTAKVLDGTVDLHATSNRSDEEIIENLTVIRGIGRWTVEMLLMFRLGRADVLPVDDYGVRKGFAVAFRKRELPTKKDLQKRGARWKPYQSVASWYLWRAAERAQRREKKKA